MSSTTDVGAKVEGVQQAVDTDPSVGLQYRDELDGWLVHTDSRVRYGALDILLKMSPAYPVQLRDHVPGIVSRLDDEAVSVRGAALGVTYNLVRWYPQEFGHTTEYLLETATTAEDKKERAMAVGVLARIAVMRPDVVTPRADIRDALRAFSDRDDATTVLDSCEVDIELVEGAIKTLAGGDMASRPLESDLAPTPRSTGVSEPVLVGCRGIVWGALLPVYYLVLILMAVRFAWRFRYLSPMGRLQVLVAEFKKVKFFKNTYRRTLYLRASMYPTTTQIFPFLPGRSPIAEQMNGQSQPLPDDWGMRANLVRHRDGFYCRNCGVGGGPNGDAELHVDHQHPRSAGGSDAPENLRTLCRECHEARHARVFDT